MRLFEKGKFGAQYVELSVREGELLGLYGDTVADGSQRKDKRQRRYPIERGISTDRREEATTTIVMLESFFDAAARNALALRFLTDLLRDQKITFPQARFWWMQAQERVGRNAAMQVEVLLRMRSQIALDPLVTVWDGGGVAAITQRAKSIAQVRRLLKWYEAQFHAEMTADALTPNLLQAYLQSMLTETTRFSHGKRMTKRTVIKHRSAINLWLRWLMDPAAAVAAGLGADQFVMDKNPLDHVRDEKITQVRGDKKQWKKGRVWYLQDEAKAIVTTIDDTETRAMLALMFGGMVEYGAIYNREGTKGPIGPTLFKRNFMFERGKWTGWVHLGGIKNRTGDPNDASLEKSSVRERDVEIPEVEGFDFYRRIVESYIKTLADDDAYITHCHKYYKTRFIAALEQLGYARKHGRLFHACRHSFAQFWKPLVMKERADGRDLDWLKQQAGHEDNSILLHTEYTESVRRKGKGEQIVSEQLSRKQRGLAIA